MRAAVLALLAAALIAVVPLPAEVGGHPPGIERTLVLSEQSAVVEMRTAALIMSGQQGGALPIAIAAVPDGKTCHAEGGANAAPTCRLTALVEIDGAALLAGSAGTGPLPVEIFAYVLGTELDVLERRTLALDLGLPDQRELLAQTGLKVFLRLEVAPGDHQLRVLVHAGEAFGLRGLDLHAGAPVAGTPAGRIRTPVFHEMISPWLIAAPTGVDVPLPPPFGLDADSPLPSARPQMPAGGILSGQVFIDNRVAHDLVAGDLVAHDLVAIVRQPEPRGGEPYQVPLTLHDRTATGDLESVAVSFTAPPGVGSGLWEIAVEVDGGARSSFVKVFIEHPPPMATAGTQADAAGRPPTGPKSSRGSQSQLARAARSGYARALRQLAEGDSRAARLTLMASEEPVVAALDADAVDVLAQGESRVLEPLADADWGCLLPVVLLHLDLSRAYRESGRRILAYHATRMTTDLADAYARKLATPQAVAEAAAALSSLAGYFQHSGARTQADRLFVRALDLATDDAALLGLATLYEKQGLYAQAVPMLERFAAERPDHAEGALRLAINRARTGQIDDARRALGELMAASDDWIALLAHQEQARLLIDDGQRSRAAEILRQGLGRWPNHPTLQIQLAWVLDAQGESKTSLELLEDLDSLATHAAAERSRYNRWPGDRLADGRRALAETARLRLPDLERWLSSQDLDGG